MKRVFLTGFVLLSIFMQSCQKEDDNSIDLPETEQIVAKDEDSKSQFFNSISGASEALEDLWSIQSRLPTNVTRKFVGIIVTNDSDKDIFLRSGSHRNNNYVIPFDNRDMPVPSDSNSALRSIGQLLGSNRVNLKPGQSFAFLTSHIGSRNNETRASLSYDILSTSKKFNLSYSVDNGADNIWGNIAIENPATSIDIPFNQQPNSRLTPGEAHHKGGISMESINTSQPKYKEIRFRIFKKFDRP